MKRTARQRLILLAAVAALLLLAGWQWQRDLRHAPGTLLRLDPAAISRVTLGLGDAPPRHYEKRDGHWWRIDGAPVRVDDSRLNQLADIAAAPVRHWRPASDFDPTRIGLQPPRMLLVLDGQRVAFGVTSVTGPQRYVQVGPQVALVSIRYTPRPPTTDVAPAASVNASP